MMPRQSYRIAPDFRQYQGFIFDLDGTIYLGNELIPGARETVEALRAAGRRVAFLTNKPLESRSELAEKLSRLGIPVTKDEVISSTYVLARYLADTKPGMRVYAVGTPSLREELAGQGLRVLDEHEAVCGPVDAVVAASDTTLTFEKLRAAFSALQAGAGFYATNPDRSYPVEDGDVPCTAGVIAFLEATTGRTVELVAGKPNALAAQTAAAVVEAPVDACIMLGDRLDTDIDAAVNADMAAAVVLTGVATHEEAEAYRKRRGLAPNRLYVLPSVRDLIE